MASSDVGSAGGVLGIDKPDWALDGEAYSFPPIVGDRVSILITKNTDRTVTVVVKGPFGNTFEFREPIPSLSRVPFEVNWKEGRVTLFLNGAQAATTTTPRKSH
jgi:hypothetical protein